LPVHEDARQLHLRYPRRLSPLQERSAAPPTQGALQPRRPVYRRRRRVQSSAATDPAR